MQKTLEDHLHSLLPNAERSKPAIRHETSAIFRGRAALPSPQPLQQVRDVLARRALLRAARRAENALLRQKRREASAENVQESVEVPAPRAPLIRSLVQRLQRAQKLRKAKTTETQKEVSTNPYYTQKIITRTDISETKHKSKGRVILTIILILIVIILLGALALSIFGDTILKTFFSK